MGNSRSRRRAILSIHDVMPSTVERVDRLAELAAKAGCRRPTLLVVPGKDWTPPGLDWLRRKASEGYPLAGHGWHHRAPRVRGLVHHLHAALMSADQAEHLSRSREESRAIVDRCFRWFSDVDLPAPDLYVPPAWALGRLTEQDLGGLGFRRYETLTGFIDASSGVRIRVPLVGFEARDVLSAWGVRASNFLNLAAVDVLRRPVRICLHPHDLERRLRGSVAEILVGPWSWMSDSELTFISPTKT